MDAEMTAMGDAVNTTARLSSLAAAGEILVPLDAAAKADIQIEGLESRSLALKGKTEPVEVIVLTA
jgi:class 3 adenylate cyclase